MDGESHWSMIGKKRPWAPQIGSAPCVEGSHGHQNVSYPKRWRVTGYEIPSQTSGSLKHVGHHPWLLLWNDIYHVQNPALQEITKIG